jgi:hypothetical protein
MLDLILPRSKLIVPRPAKLVRLVLPKLHPMQDKVVNDVHRVVVAAMGSKWGKTYGMSVWLLRHAWNRYQSMNWWCGPTFRQAKIAMRLMLWLIPPSRRRVRQSDLAIDLIQDDGSIHSMIEFRSADRPETLRGEGVHAAVADEARFWRYESYVSVWTTLSQTQGLLRVISTPGGRNYFFDEFMKGTPEHQAEFPEFASYTCPTHDNPHVPRASLEEFKRNLPAHVYRQEILAEFLDESAGVFTNFKNVQTGHWLTAPETGHVYVLAIDWAKQSNYTVFTVADRATRGVVYLERFTAVDWNSQIDRAIRLAKTWNHAHIIMDSTGVGDVPYDMIRAVYADAEGYSISNNIAKVPLIQKLQVAFERAEIQLPLFATNELTRLLQRELEVFGYRISTQGKWIYGAPQGQHDDMVMSLALCWWNVSTAPFIYRHKLVRGV